MTGHRRCALVVEPNESVRIRLCAIVESLSMEASGASTVRQAMQSLSPGLDLVLINAALPDAPLGLVEAAFTLRTPPAIFVTGDAPEPHRVFELAKAGAHAYLAPPISAATLQARLCGLSASPNLGQLVRPLLGHLGMKEILAHVRRALLIEALARSKGSRRSAAQLLGVTRPAIQKWLRGEDSHGLTPSESW